MRVSASAGVAGGGPSGDRKARRDCTETARRAVLTSIGGACRRGRWASARRRAGSSPTAPSRCAGTRTRRWRPPGGACRGPCRRGSRGPPPAAAGRRWRWSAGCACEASNIGTSSSSTSSDARTSAATVARSSSSPPRPSSTRPSEIRITDFGPSSAPRLVQHRADRRRPSGRSAGAGRRRSRRPPARRRARSAPGRRRRTRPSTRAAITWRDEQRVALAVDGERLGQRDVEAPRLARCSGR